MSQFAEAWSNLAAAYLRKKEKCVCVCVCVWGGALLNRLSIAAL